MTWNNRVVWSEGMFLRPQHFQQHDRFLENFINGRCSAVSAYGWGVSVLTIDKDLLSLGKIGIAEAKGVLPDGTPFNIPADDEAPPPLDVVSGTTNAEVFLSLSVKRPGALEVSEGESTELTRYKSLIGEVQDNSGAARTASQVPIGRLQLALTTSDDQSGNFVRIGVGRIIELRPDGMVVMDDQFIPSCLNCCASPRLHGFLTEILGLLNHRGEAIAGRITHAGGGGISEIADYLLLQVVNRYEPLFGHLAQTALIHPEGFYSLALQFAGELGTFTSDNHRTASFPVYDHDRPQECMTAVMTEIRRSLSMVLDQTAIELPLEERRYGIRVATISDRGLFNAANFVLAVSADTPAEVLSSQFPRQVKIGAVEKIADLVNLQLPGVTVRLLPVAPRQIPYHAGCSYFELEKKSEHWRQLTNSAGIAVHAGSDFPGIDVHLWAIKE